MYEVGVWIASRLSAGELLASVSLALRKGLIGFFLAATDSELSTSSESELELAELVLEVELEAEEELELESSSLMDFFIDDS